tara:strand:- start:213 stop:467 length:255 start_codon:yes stop_codon:yes gene_type:complete
MEDESIINTLNLKTENAMLNYVKDNIKYLVVYPNRETKTYKSLKQIEKDICINASTISKKLKYSDSNIFTAKGMGYLFYIFKLN